ncbi:MAG: urease accessory protein UreD [Halioglobus sp.]|nr:urease accessory protein UreD [Halioglobus sp.]
MWKGPEATALEIAHATSSHPAPPAAPVGVDPTPEMGTAPGWRARLTLDYGLRGSRTRLVGKSQSGPLTVQRAFYPEGATCHNYILHPPGGVVGGDSLEIAVHTGTGAHCLLTTPGATKFYRSSALLPGRQVQRFHVDEGAVTEWLPQQNIYFSGAHAELETHIDIARGGRFLGWELHCFGRPSNDETFSCGSLHSCTRVSVGGELRLLEQLHHSQAADMLFSATGLRGMAMQGSFIAAPCSEAQRDLLAQILHADTGENYPHPVGLTLVDDVLIVRALGGQAEPMVRLFTRCWSGLRQQWLNKAPCVPRIWAT